MPKIHVDNFTPGPGEDKRFNIIAWLTDALDERKTGNMRTNNDLLPGLLREMQNSQGGAEIVDHRGEK